MDCTVQQQETVWSLNRGDSPVFAFSSRCLHLISAKYQQQQQQVDKHGGVFAVCTGDRGGLLLSETGEMGYWGKCVFAYPGWIWVIAISFSTWSQFDLQEKVYDDHPSSHGFIRMVDRFPSIMHHQNEFFSFLPCLLSWSNIDPRSFFTFALLAALLWVRPRSREAIFMI